MGTSEGLFTGSWGGVMFGGLLMISVGYLLRIIFGANKGFGYDTIVDLALGETYVASLGRYDGIRGGEDLVMKYGKIWVIRLKEQGSKF